MANPLRPFASLSRRPAFAVLALITLSIGIGAITAVFSILNAVILRPLPYDKPREIVMLHTRRVDSSSNDTVSVDDFHDWQKLNHAFSQLTAFVGWTYNLTESGEPERIFGVRASGTFFQL